MVNRCNLEFVDQLRGESRIVQPGPPPNPAIPPAAARPALVRPDGRRPSAPVEPLRAVGSISRQAAHRYAAPAAERRDDAPDTADAPRAHPARPTRITRREDGGASGHSSLFLAQHIAQERLPDGGARAGNEAASLGAYRDAAERGAIFYGLEFPVDLYI